MKLKEIKNKIECRIYEVQDIIMKLKEIKNKIKYRICEIDVWKVELIKGLIGFMFLICISVISSTYIVEKFDSNLNSGNKIYLIYDYDNHPYEMKHLSQYISKIEYKSELDKVIQHRVFLFTLSLMLLIFYIKRKYRNISENRECENDNTEL